MENLGPHQNIVVRRYKKGRHDEHGGAWKVAMADFALAMMALFLVLWVVNSSSKQQREAISGYFQDPKAFTEGQKVPSRYVIDLGGSPSVNDNVAERVIPEPDKILQAEEIESLADAIEIHRLESMKAQIETRIEASSTLSPFKNQLLLDITREGLRLQIVDQSGRPMFDTGSARLKYYSEDILWELAPLLGALAQRLSIAGHTDSVSMGGARDADDDNWALSSMRADSARRALMEAGVAKAQIAEVIGMGDTAPLTPDDPYAEVNRRISITLLNKRSEETVRDRAGDGQVEFINDNPHPTENEQQPLIKQADSLLKTLREQREDDGNSYDNPPNKSEVFW